MPDGRPALARGQQRGFVDQIGQIGADEARRDRGDLLQIDRLVQLDVLDVDLEDGFPPADVRPVDQDLPVEAARPQQRLVQRFRPVGRRDHDHAGLRVEAVHFDQQRVQRLLALVVPADHAAHAALAQRVQFVDEDDAGGFGFGLLEQVPDAGGADAHEHLDEIAAGQAEERHARLAGDRLGQQRLARARRADQQDTLGNPSAQTLVFFGGIEEIDHFADLLDGFVDPRHVVERDVNVLLSVQLSSAAAERHGRSGAAQPPQHEEETARRTGP